MLERKTESRAAVTLTLGATREKLIANGYTPVSQIMRPAPATPFGPGEQPPLWLISEHPVALQTLGRKRLAALILTPPEDTLLDQRTRTVLEGRGLTRGPVRVGSDRRELWPLRTTDSQEVHGVALHGAVELISATAVPGLGLQGALVPLDGLWGRGDLLSVPYEKLPLLEDWQALISELDRLPYLIAQEQAPPPRPSKRAWLGDAS